MTDPDAIISMIDQYAGGSETSQVQTFRTYRENSELVVNIYDRGSDAGSRRYSVEVYDVDTDPTGAINGETSRYSMGNADGSLSMAIANVHWHNFGERDY